MSDRAELYELFLDTLSPQQRLNMALAMELDTALDRTEEKSGDAVDEEILEMLGQDLVKTQETLRDMKRELAVLRGAVEETIVQLRQLQKMAQHPGPWTVEKPDAITTAVREEQQKAAEGLTPSGHRSRAKRFRGVYCRNCGKELKGKHQSVFCSRKCGARWRAQHPDEVARPRLTLKDDFEATVVAGVGVRE